MKDKIKETAARLFADKGYTSTSLREIAEAVGVTKAALYYHYPNKEAIFRAVVEDNFRNHLQQEITVTENSPDVWSALHNWALCNVRNAIDFPNTRRLIFFTLQGRFRNQIQIDFEPLIEQSFQSLVNIIKRGIAAREVRNDMEPELLASMIIPAVNGAIMGRQFRVNGEFDPENLTKQIIMFIKEGSSIQ
ncbi:MAG: TetR/AcrR family transcriptional regulator [Lentisphaeria bacterium]|nr:TetR/AcrR family transcriptional regulator [Candidatus Neomarinimicrobiota bacterium]MCF7842491.1 TetR/AcrR family transcriptional regulator [Lentisphaeria bacterium]